MDIVEDPILLNLPELCALVSQSFNNAAIILYDADRADLARTFLHKAIKVCPDNQTARENLQTIS
jgi:Flp pilus assembly protein TadD